MKALRDSWADYPEEPLGKAGFPRGAGEAGDAQVTLHHGSLIFYQCNNLLEETKQNKKLFSAWLRVDAQ